MAGLSTQAIKTRIKSMASTRQITKAMELVASSKLRSAQSRAVACRPYFTALYEAMNEIADSSRSFESPYLRQAGPGKTIYIVIAGDRGLAGGYNNNVLKLAFRQMPQDAVVLPIGKKTVEFFQHRSCEILTEEYREAASVSIGDCYSIAKLVADGFLDKTYQNVVLVYTNFVSLLAQTPAALPLLPLTISAEKQTNAQRAMIYEGGSEAVFNAIVPEYLGGVLYGALCESTASEQAARRMAMDAASKNADEIIENLNLQYNRARQGAITQEITEIVAGSEN